MKYDIKIEIKGLDDDYYKYFNYKINDFICEINHCCNNANVYENKVYDESEE